MSLTDPGTPKISTPTRCVGIESARRTGRTLLPVWHDGYGEARTRGRLYDIDSVLVVKERVKDHRPAILPW